MVSFIHKGIRTGFVSRVVVLALAGVSLAAATPPASALSMRLGEPDIFFAKGYDQKKAASILGVLQDKKFHYLDGLTSFWEPEYGTYLDYGGDTASLQQFVDALSRLQGIRTKLSFSRKLERKDWQVKYSQTEPDTLSVTINLKSEQIDLEKLVLPSSGG